MDKGLSQWTKAKCNSQGEANENEETRYFWNTTSVRGSILAPYFFTSLYPGNRSSSKLDVFDKYAEDFISIPFNLPCYLSSKVQEESEFLNWCDKLGPVINRRKTKSIVFSNFQCSIFLLMENLNSHLTTLGITFDEILKWELHIESVTKKTIFQNDCWGRLIRNSCRTLWADIKIYKPLRFGFLLSSFSFTNGSDIYGCSKSLSKVSLCVKII